MNFNLKDISLKGKGELIGKTENLKINGISIDTRSIKKDDLFVALRGSSNDGHSFINEAEKKGASSFVVEKHIQTIKPYILVEDSYRFLDTLGKEKRKEFKGNMICITGSNGKTTTKEIIYSILNPLGSCHKTYGNQNNQLGVPLTLCFLDEEHIFSVVEIGSNSPGEIDYLAKMVKPKLALITNAANSHLKDLGSIENVAKEKGSIVDHVEKGGFVILPRDSSFYDEWRDRSSDKRVISFGCNEKADVVLKKYEIDVANSLMTFKIECHGQNLECEMKSIGYHNSMNACAALAVGFALDLDLSELSKNLKKVKFLKRRLRVHKFFKNSILIDDTYNSNPESMKRSLDVLAESDKKNKICIVGEMAELGTKQSFFHESVCKYAEDKVDQFLCVGKLWESGMKHISSKSKLFHSKDELINYFIQNLKEDSIILIKGSRITEMDYVVERLKVSNVG